MVKADGHHGTRVPRAAPPRSRERGRTNHPHATALLPAKPNDHRGRVAENVARLHQQRVSQKTQRPRRTSVTRTRPPVREAARKRVALIALDVCEAPKICCRYFTTASSSGRVVIDNLCMWYSADGLCSRTAESSTKPCRKPGGASPFSD